MNNLLFLTLKPQSWPADHASYPKILSARSIVVSVDIISIQAARLVREVKGREV